MLRSITETARRSARAVVAGVLMVTATSAVGLAPHRADALPPGFQDELVISGGIAQSTALVALPDGRLLVGQRDGTIHLVDANATPATKSTFAKLADVDRSGEKGLLNIALDPDFATNGNLYVYYHNAATDRARISRFDSHDTALDTSSELIIWEDELTTSLQIISDHWGGGLSFGPDGNLYVTIGDKKDDPTDAQDLTLAAGKVLRLDPDGADTVGPWIHGQHNPHMIPTDNPFADGPAGNLDEVWALGLRNPFRARWDLATGRFFISEVGGNFQSGDDASHEDLHMVTLDEGGANFGWPACEGPDCVGAPPSSYSAPVFSVQHPDSRAMMLGPIYRGSGLSNAYDGAIFLFDFVYGWLRYVYLDDTGRLDPAVPIGGLPFAASGELDKPLDMTVGPNGDLYYVGSGQVRRITASGVDLPPVIDQVSGTPTSSPAAPATVEFQSDASDPEGQALTYTWDFGDGAQSTAANPVHTYSANGTYQVLLSVSDGSNTTSAPTFEIEVGVPPEPVIQTPSDGSLFRAGDVIEVRGTATDADGSPTADDSTWTVEFVHDSHAHPVLDAVAGTPCAPAGSSCLMFSIPTEGHDFSDSTAFRFRFDVTDDDGLTRSDTISILPDKVDLTFDADTPGGGVPLLVDGVPRTTPFVLDTLIGFDHTIEAPPTHVDGGRRYEFDAWSSGDRGNVLAVVVPSADAMYTARYTDIDPTDARVTAGLQTLYAFDTGPGPVVSDVSGSADPLDLVIDDPDAVTWTPGALSIDEPTVLRSSGGVAALAGAIEGSNEISVESWVTPSDLTQTGPARMVSIGSSATRRNLTLGQGNNGSVPGDRYTTRLRTTSTSKNGTPSVSTPAGSASTELTHVLYTRDAAGQVAFYIDGAVATTATVGGSTTNWDPSYDLLLGNEADGSRPWLGTFHLVAIYDRALSEVEVGQNFAAGPRASVPTGRPPVAADDRFTTDEDSVLSGDVLGDNGNGADIDPDGDTLTVTAIDGVTTDVGRPLQSASGAILTVNADGTFEYDPSGVFDALEASDGDVDGFTYTVDDGSQSDDASVVIDVTGVNDAPTFDTVAARSIVAGASTDVQVTVDDAEGDPLVLTLDSSSPSFASLVDTGGGIGTVTLSPSGADVGTHVVRVDATDGQPVAGTASTSFVVTVSEPTRPPVARDDSFSTNEDSTIAGDVTADNGGGPDIDPDGDSVTVEAIEGASGAVGQPLQLASGATLTLDPDGSFVYEPAGVFDFLRADQDVTDGFEYTISDGLLTDDAAVTIEIDGVNDAPSFAAAPDVSVNADESTDISIAATDPEADVLTLTLGPDAPAFVSLVDRGDGTGTLTVSPTADDAGTSTVSVLAVDDGVPNRSSSATFDVTVTVSSSRVVDGLAALFTFDDGPGPVVRDVSGVGSPLDLVIADVDAVSWGSGSLTIESPVVIASAGHTGKINAAVTASDEVTVEAWVAPADTSQSGPARIVSISQSPTRRNLTLGQGGTGRVPGDRYDVRLRTTSTSSNGTPSVTSPAGSLTTEWTHVVYTRNAAGQASIYANGEVVSSAEVGGTLDTWDPALRLFLANEADGSRPWLGSFELVAFYSRALAPDEVAQNFGAGATG